MLIVNHSRVVVFLNLISRVSHPFVAEDEAVEVLWSFRAQRRQASPELPETVTCLTAPDGSLLYLVGTSHFSDSSKKDVSMVSMTETLNTRPTCPHRFIIPTLEMAILMS